LSDVPLQCESVPQKEAHKECEKGDPWGLKKFRHEHPTEFNVLLAISRPAAPPTSASFHPPVRPSSTPWTASRAVTASWPGGPTNEAPPPPRSSRPKLAALRGTCGHARRPGSFARQVLPMKRPHETPEPQHRDIEAMEQTEVWVQIEIHVLELVAIAIAAPVIYLIVFLA
ncbi:hypothetical protein KXX11_003828, partial [Aspergillus fumigatus]